MSAVLLQWDPARGDPIVLDDRSPLWKCTLTEGLDSLPEMRGDSQIVPFLPGRTWTPRVGDRRALVISGRLKTRAPDDYRVAVEALKRPLDPTLPAGVLRVTEEDGRELWTGAQVHDVLWESRHSPIARSFSIELDGDPFWYGDWGAWLADTGLYADTGLFADEGTEVVFSPDASPDAVTFNASGSTDNRSVRVEIDGPSTGPVQVSNEIFTNGSQRLGFQVAALGVGDTVVVDTGLRTVTLNGGQARQSLIPFHFNEHGEYFRLTAGSNTVRVTGQPAEVRLSFPTVWI